MLKCNSCGGTYEPILSDGMRYFHRCPPVAEYFDATRTPITRAQAEAIMRVGGTYFVRYVDRPNLRDENVTGARDAQGQAMMTAAGAGAIDIPPPPPDPLEGAVRVVVPPPVP